MRDYRFKKNQRVVKIITIFGTESATIEDVVAVKKGVVHLHDTTLKYNQGSGTEYDPAFVGDISSRIIPFDGEPA